MALHLSKAAKASAHLKEEFEKKRMAVEVEIECCEIKQQAAQQSERSVEQAIAHANYKMVVLATRTLLDSISMDKHVDFDLELSAIIHYAKFTWERAFRAESERTEAWYESNRVEKTFVDEVCLSLSCGSVTFLCIHGQVGRFQSVHLRCSNIQQSVQAIEAQDIPAAQLIRKLLQKLDEGISTGHGVSLG